MFGLCALAVDRLSFWSSIITDTTAGTIKAPFVTFFRNSRLSGLTQSRNFLLPFMLTSISLSLSVFKEYKFYQISISLHRRPVYHVEKEKTRTQIRPCLIFHFPPIPPQYQGKKCGKVQYFVDTCIFYLDTPKSST